MGCQICPPPDPFIQVVLNVMLILAIALGAMAVALVALAIIVLSIKALGWAWFTVRGR